MSIATDVVMNMTVREYLTFVDEVRGGYGNSYHVLDFPFIERVERGQAAPVNART